MYSRHRLLPLVLIGTLGLLLASDLRSHADLINHKCQAYQACRAAPQCPTVTGECDSCTAYANHDECVSLEHWTCGSSGPDVDGCGFKREGTCGFLDTCEIFISGTPCDRDACYNVG